MKIRLMGSADLVRAWSKKLEASYGIKGAEYPSRYGGNDIRAYFDLDAGRPPRSPAYRTSRRRHSRHRCRGGAASNGSGGLV